MAEENDLEAQRLANMAANAQQMQEFGLHEAARSVRPKAKAVQPPRPRCMQQLSCAFRDSMASVIACMPPSDSKEQSCMLVGHGCASLVMIRFYDSHDFKPPSSRVLRLQACTWLNGAAAHEEVRKVRFVVGTHVQQGWVSVQLLRGIDRQLAEACTIKRSAGPRQVHATQASALVSQGGQHPGACILRDGSLRCRGAGEQARAADQKKVLHIF